MSKTTINNLDIFYQEFGKGRDTMLLLHGWGQSHSFWKDVIDKYATKYHIYTLDLPGFGLSQEPSTTWSLYKYADFIHQFITTFHITNLILIGHSFGGRVSSIYASKYPIKKLVLYSNGGLPQNSLKTKLNKNVVVKIGKYFFPNLLYKSHTIIFKPKHYQNKVVINRKRSRRMLDVYIQPSPNLHQELQKITTPTLIIAGKKDYIVSPQMGQRLHKLVKNSRLVEVPAATHFSHIESPKIFYSALDKLLEEDSIK